MPNYRKAPPKEVIAAEFAFGGAVQIINDEKPR